MTAVPRTFRGLDALVQKSLSFRFLRSRNARMFCLSFKLITDRDVCHLFRVFSKLRYAFAVLKYEKPALRQISSKITTADIFFRNKLARGISWKKKNNVGNNQHYILMKRFYKFLVWYDSRYSRRTAHTTDPEFLAVGEEFNPGLSPRIVIPNKWSKQLAFVTKIFN